MTYSSEVLADSPRVYWRLGETSGTTATDLSGGARNGAIAGSPTLGTTGLVGDSNTAITFDGVNDKVSIAESLSLSAFTIEAWIKKTGAPSATQYIAERDDFSAPLFSLGVSSTGAPVAFYKNTSGFNQTATGPTSVCDGQVHHLAATWTSAGNFILYVDGVAVSTIAAFGGSVNGSGQFVTGALGSGANWFSGVIDEVAYYTTALSSTRIAAHYTAGGGGAPATVTGAAAGVLSTPTAALSGTVAPPVTGTVAATLALPTTSLAGTATPPAITGTLAGALDVPTGALTGNTAAPDVVTGTLAGVLNGPTAALAGATTAPVGAVTGTVAWILSDDVTTGGVGGGGTSTGTGFDLSLAEVTGGSYTADETIEPTAGTASFAFPGIDLDPTKVYTFSVALEPTDVAALTASVGGTTFYDTATDPNVTLTGVGDLVQVTFTLGPGLSGTPVFTVTDALVWSVDWDGGVTLDTQPTPDPDPVFGALPDVAVLHVVAPSVPVPTLVAGRPT